MYDPDSNPRSPVAARAVARAGITACAVVMFGACVAHAPLHPEPPAAATLADGDPVARAIATMQEPALSGAADTARRDRRLAASAVPDWDELEPVDTTEFVLASDEQDVIGVVQLIRARGEDTFSDIARTYGLGYDDLVHANPGIDPWLPGDGTLIVLPTQFVLPPGPREGVVLNIAAKRLFYFPPRAAGEPQRVVTHPIGIGRVGWATPVGTSRVIAKAKDPTWYVPWSVRQEHLENGDPLPAVVPPGEDNPLGHRVLKLDMEGYLIHGTNQPYGVGMRVSHGCVRLYPENIETLYERVAIGTAVRIVNEPVLAGWHDGAYFLQSHPRLEDDERRSSDAAAAVVVEALSEFKYVDGEMLRRAVDDTLERARGYPIVLLNRDASLAAAAPRVVRNVVVVDNPVSEDELREVLDASAEPQT